MERSLVARLVGPLGLPALRRPPRSPASRPRPREKPSRSSSGLRPLDRTRALLALLWRGRRTRIALIAVLIALPVLAGGYLLLRNSSFVAVRRVQVSGVHGAEAQAIEAALVTAARHMSTLDIHAGALRAAVAPFRVVSSIRAIPSFPHGLRIEVSEQLPVAALLVSSQRTAVAADGIVLGPALLSSSLPTLTGYLVQPPGARLHSPFLLESLAVLGAAPRALARHVAKVYTGPEGLTVAMGNGLLAYFGDSTLPHAKWLSLARVLADHSSAGAAYVDVRLPARPAAGFPAGAGPASSPTGEGSPAAEATGSSESTVGALAAGLSKEGGTSTTATEPSPKGAASEEAKTTSGGTGESESASPAEAGQEAPAPGG
jgi:cell division septal protein FtsQ